MMILAGDVGGTKSHLILKDGEKVVREHKFFNRDFSSFGAVLSAFLKESKHTIDRACLGIAGPIFNNTCSATNLPWVIDGNALAKEFRMGRVVLINDMEANAYGLACLKDDEFVVLNEGTALGNAALISAGTGLGEAGLFWDGKQHCPFASEGSHADFAPRSEMEVELFLYLKERHGHVSFERVVSGMGITNLYRFLIDKGIEKGEIEKDDPKEISERALKGSDKASVRAIEWFVSLYASEAGNLALKYLAKGGVYLGGGIAPKCLPFFKKGPFMEAFADKGRFQSMLLTFPVKIILNEGTALLGAAAHANR